LKKVTRKYVIETFGGCILGSAVVINCLKTQRNL